MRMDYVFRAQMVADCAVMYEAQQRGTNVCEDIVSVHTHDVASRADES